MSIGIFRATAIGAKLGKALIGKKGDDAEIALREQLYEIRMDLSEEEQIEVSRLIKVAAEVLG
jgi:hypothetical protein